MRFTIRDLLWLTVVVALGVAWFAEHKRLRAAHAEVQQVQKLAKEQAERAETDFVFIREDFQRRIRQIESQLAEHDLELRLPATGGAIVSKRWKSYPFTPGRPGPIK